MNESAIKQTVTARIETLLAQQEVIQAALANEQRELQAHKKELIKRDGVCEEKAAVIDSYKRKIKAIKVALKNPDNEQMLLTLAGPDFQPLGE
jgi:hypothetical protein